MTVRRRLWLESLESRLAPATFTVTNDNNSGAGSLRRAILDANAASGVDLIDFSSYFNTPRTITLASQISITGPVTVDGPSAANVTISGNNAGGIFNTQAAAAGTAISFVDLALTRGSAAIGGAISMGDEAITTTRCVLTQNFGGEGGGAIGIVGDGSLTATDCTFTGNAAYNQGGGAVLSRTVASSVVLRRCEISGNGANDSFNDLNGGGGVNVFGNFLLEESIVSGNTAAGYDPGGPYGGGGIFGYGGGLLVINGSLATIRNSTISDNLAPNSDGRSYGGGIYISHGTLVVQNSTLTGNTAGVGGGIFSGGWAGSAVSLESCIVAANSAGAGPDMASTTANVRTSSIFSRSGIVTLNDLGGNRPEGEDPRLGQIQNNGGPTKTFALLHGSPCLNVGSNPGNLTYDQRGSGFPRVLSGAPDMGAYEGVYPIPLAAPISIPPTITAPGGTSYAVVVRYDDDIGIDLSTIDLGDIRVTGPGYAVSQAPTARSISGSGQLVTVTYTLPAPGGTFDFFDAGQYSVDLLANQVGDTDSPVQHFVAAGLLGTFRVAISGTLVVDEPTDIDDGVYTPGRLSLREALRLTNAAAGTNVTITFDPAVFGTPRTITLTSGPYTVNASVVVVGPGSARLTLDAANASRHFLIGSPDVSLTGFTLVNGRAIESGTSAGGAIAADYPNGGDLTLTDIVATNCEANYLGGAISTPGSLTLRNCVIANNRAVYGGGIIAGAGSVFVSNIVLERSTIANNQATGGSGGGIYWNGTGQIQITESTISSNQIGSGVGGGGVYLRGYTLPGSFIRNSTISDNVASPAAPTSGGGGLFLNLIGSLSIANSTITGNTAGYGGGLVHANAYYNPDAISLSSTIIAGNSSSSAAGNGPDLYCSVTDPITVVSNNCLIGVADAGFFTLAGTGNLTGTAAAPFDPMLSPLADNGGPTRTHALLPGSPALDAGNNAAGLTTDQRGPGFVRVSDSQADIGAFEVQPTAPTVASTVVSNGSAQRSRVASLGITFNAQVTITGSVDSAFTLTRAGGGSVAFTATASIVGGVSVVTLNTFTGPETEFGSLRDGNYTLTALASQISANGQPMAANYTFNFHRFYGDMNGDRRVDISDFGFFSLAYLQPANYNAALDFNADGRIDIADFGQFSVRYFTTLP